MNKELLPFEKIERKVIIRREFEINPELGCRPEERPIPKLIEYGIVNVNKTDGPTSHQISDYVQKILGITKAGHSGTLDPGVTGCLPIALDKATRIVQTLLISGKEYVGIMHLHKDIDEATFNKVLQEFTGKINQIPPRKSAVKRQLRQREIYYFRILEVDGRDILFKIGCEAGTYIRKICDDFGKKLGFGAHMQELIRTKVGPFSINESFTLHDLHDAFTVYKNENNEIQIRKVIQPMEKAVEHLSKIWVFDKAINNLCHGSDLFAPGVAKLHHNIKRNEVIAIMSLKDELVCLAEAELDSEQMMEKEKGLIAKTKKVFMERNLYN